MNVCRSCNAPIFWSTHPGTGKPNPIDDEAVPDGNIRLDLEAGTYVVLAGSMLQEARARGEILHKSHFATCPNSKTHRKGAQ